MTDDQRADSYARRDEMRVQVRDDVAAVHAIVRWIGFGGLLAFVAVIAFAVRLESDVRNITESRAQDRTAFIANLADKDARIRTLETRAAATDATTAAILARLDGIRDQLARLERAATQP